MSLKKPVASAVCAAFLMTGPGRLTTQAFAGAIAAPQSGAVRAGTPGQVLAVPILNQTGGSIMPFASANLDLGASLLPTPAPRPDIAVNPLPVADARTSAKSFQPLAAQLANSRQKFDLDDAGSIKELGSRLDALFENPKSLSEDASDGAVADTDSTQKMTPNPGKLQESATGRTITTYRWVSPGDSQAEPRFERSIASGLSLERGEIIVAADRVGGDSPVLITARGGLVAVWSYHSPGDSGAKTTFKRWAAGRIRLRRGERIMGAALKNGNAGFPVVATIKDGAISTYFRIPGGDSGRADRFEGQEWGRVPLDAGERIVSVDLTGSPLVITARDGAVAAWFSRSPGDSGAKPTFERLAVARVHLVEGETIIAARMQGDGPMLVTAKDRILAAYRYRSGGDSGRGAQMDREAIGEFRLREGEAILSAYASINSAALMTSVGEALEETKAPAPRVEKAPKPGSGQAGRISVGTLALLAGIGLAATGGGLLAFGPALAAAVGLTHSAGLMALGLGAALMGFSIVVRVDDASNGGDGLDDPVSNTLGVLLALGGALILANGLLELAVVFGLISAVGGGAAVVGVLAAPVVGNVKIEFSFKVNKEHQTLLTKVFAANSGEVLDYVENVVGKGMQDISLFVPYSTEQSGEDILYAVTVVKNGRIIGNFRAEINKRTKQLHLSPNDD